MAAPVGANSEALCFAACSSAEHARVSSFSLHAAVHKNDMPHVWSDSVMPALSVITDLLSAAVPRRTLKVELPQP